MLKLRYYLRLLTVLNRGGPTLTLILTLTRTTLTRSVCLETDRCRGLRFPIMEGNLQVGGCAKRNAVTFAWAWADVIGSEKVHLRISAALDALQTAVTPEVRCWAADGRRARAAQNQSYALSKTPADFIAAYLRVPLKHAYEVIDDVRGCHPFLDLPIHSSAEYEAACRVLCTAASNVLNSVAGRNGVATNEQLVVDILLLDVRRPFGSAGTGKF